MERRGALLPALALDVPGELRRPPTWMAGAAHADLRHGSGGSAAWPQADRDGVLSTVGGEDSVADGAATL